MAFLPSDHVSKFTLCTLHCVHFAKCALYKFCTVQSSHRECSSVSKWAANVKNKVNFLMENAKLWLELCPKLYSCILFFYQNSEVCGNVGNANLWKWWKMKVVTDKMIESESVQEEVGSIFPLNTATKAFGSNGNFWHQLFQRQISP